MPARVNLTYGLPTTFSSILTCPKHPYKIPSLSYLLSALLSISSGPTFHSITIYLQYLNSLYPTPLIFPLNMTKPPQPAFHMTSPMSSIASILLTHSLLFLSLKLTPVIHLNILILLLYVFLLFSTFTGHVSLPYNISGLIHVV